MLAILVWLRCVKWLCPGHAIWWHISGSTLAQVTICCLTTPKHYLNQCWPPNRGVLWHSPESNFTGNAQAGSPYNKFEKNIFKITATNLPGDNELIGLGYKVGLTTFWVSIFSSVILNLHWSPQSSHSGSTFTPTVISPISYRACLIWRSSAAMG